MSHLMADPFYPRLMLVVDTYHGLIIILNISLIDEEDSKVLLEVGSEHEVVIAVQAFDDFLKMPDGRHFIVEALPSHEVPRVVVPPEVLAPGVMEVLVGRQVQRILGQESPQVVLGDCRPDLGAHLLLPYELLPIEELVNDTLYIFGKFV